MIQLHAGRSSLPYLATFAAKLGMALYREHIGEPLPLDGAVYSKPFLNAGLSDQSIIGVLSKLSIQGMVASGGWHFGLHPVSLTPA